MKTSSVTRCKLLILVCSLECDFDKCASSAMNLRVMLASGPRCFCGCRILSAQANKYKQKGALMREGHAHVIAFMYYIGYSA